MQTIVDTIKAWQPHPFVDHFTIALVILAVLVDLFASLASSRLWIRYMAVSLMVLAAIATAGSYATGGWEANRLWDQVTGPAKDILKRHAELGSWLPWVFGALALWRLGIQFIGFISGLRPLYLLIAVIAAIVIIYQGYLGGQLVYVYGVGTGAEAAGAVTQAATAAATPSPSPSEPTPVPTVYVPPPSTPAPTPAAPLSSASPSPLNSPAGGPVVSGTLPASPSPASSPAATPTPSPGLSSSSSGTPVNPPSGEAPKAATQSPVPTPTSL